MYDIFCFGDSITYGEFDEIGGGWVDRLKKVGFESFITKGRDHEVKVTNLGNSGEYSHQGLARMEQEYKARLDEDLKPIFIFAYGANDNSFFPADNHYGTPKEDFKKNLEQMAALGKKYDAQVLFLGITPVIESMNATPNHRGKVRNNALVKEYSEVIKAVAEEQGATYIDIPNNFPADETLFASDGLHPNAKGHELIFEIVKKSLSFFN